MCHVTSLWRHDFEMWISTDLLSPMFRCVRDVICACWHIDVPCWFFRTSSLCSDEIISLFTCMNSSGDAVIYEFQCRVCLYSHLLGCHRLWMLRCWRAKRLSVLVYACEVKFCFALQSSIKIITYLTDLFYYVQLAVSCVELVQFFCWPIRWCVDRLGRR